MYYALGHISRFLTPRSVRIGLVKPSDPFIEAVAVKLPSRENSNPIYDSLAVVILNRFVCTLYIIVCNALLKKTFLKVQLELFQTVSH